MRQLRIFAAMTLLAVNQPALAASRCEMTNGLKRCESSFGPGTSVTYGDASGNVNRLIIDDPNTSIEPEKLLIVVGLAMMKLSPKLTQDQRADALKKLLAIGAAKSTEQLRLGNWNWGATYVGKHLTLTAALAH